MSDKSDMTVKQALIFLAIVPFVAVFRAWILTILWAWFFVAPFGLPQVSIPTMIGITIFMSTIHAYMSYSKDDTQDDFITTLGRLIGLGVLFPAISVFFGWIVTMFM